MHTDTATNKKRSHPTLIIIRGIPGSGKSYLASALKESIGSDRVIILDPDSIDQAGKEYIEFSQALAAEGVDAKLHPYRFSRARAHAGISEHKVIIWNQGFMDLDGFNKTVNNLQAFAVEQGTILPMLIVEVEVHGDIAKERVAKRAAGGGHDVPEDAFDRFIANYASFSDKGHDTLILDGQNEISVSVSAVKKALERIT